LGIHISVALTLTGAQLDTLTGLTAVQRAAATEDVGPWSQLYELPRLVEAVAADPGFAGILDRPFIMLNPVGAFWGPDGAGAEFAEHAPATTEAEDAYAVSVMAKVFPGAHDDLPAMQRRFGDLIAGLIGVPADDPGLAMAYPPVDY